ncbi:MAG TPA: amidohydrolase family protein [Candidatus Hydrogenedentes bacterium]|nr:amidohydrolase family protein [Candidatus Hydrogenedentota bacterium]
MIIDCHVHILNADDAHLRTLLDAADRCGIDKLCITSLGRTWAEFPPVQDLEDAASDIADACANYPERFIGGVYVSAEHVEASLTLLRRHLVPGGCRFVKLWVSQFADDPRLDPIAECCIERNAPILAHAWIKATGNMAKESTCHHVVHLARRFPDLRIWLAHASGRWEEAARIVCGAPNVGMDISGGEPEDGIVQTLLKHIGPDRLFFGSDAPGRNMAVQMSKVHSAGLGEHEQAMILGENVRRWLDV